MCSLWPCNTCDDIKYLSTYGLEMFNLFALLLSNKNTMILTWKWSNQLQVLLNQLFFHYALSERLKFWPYSCALVNSWVMFLNTLFFFSPPKSFADTFLWLHHSDLTWGTRQKENYSAKRNVTNICENMCYEHTLT